MNALICSNCGFANDQDNRFCTNCGKDLQETMGSSSTTIEPDEKGDRGEGRAEMTHPSAHELHSTYRMTIKASDAGLESDLHVHDVVLYAKRPNTPCFWIGLSYWNLYFTNQGVFAAQLYNGYWGLIGGLVGLFLYVVLDAFTTALGILMDKTFGEGKCREHAGQLGQILSNRAKYPVVERHGYDQPAGLDASDLCLGSLWLKYKITIGGESFYLEERYVDQARKLLAQHFTNTHLV